MAELKNIRLLSEKELVAFFEEIGEKKFRAKQVYEWLWKKRSTSFSGMTNLSEKLQLTLSEHFFIASVTIKTFQQSNDKTIKDSFRLYDGSIVEGVLIPSNKRMTACISTQVGCSLSCKFCATGRLKRERNINFDEIYDQVFLLNEQAIEHYGKHLTNVVYMGMGEPLLNYAHTIASIEKLTSEKGLGMSPKRITVSTAGIAKMIKKLGDDEVKFNLALSLHAANDKKRSEIMPINDGNSLDVLADSLEYFYKKTGTRVTYEYIIFKEFNDTIEDAKELATFCKVVPCKINIIEYNSIGDKRFQQTTQEKLEQFVAHLESCNLIVNVRRSRGKDIDAACGQLANRAKSA
ncbi:MAG: 23S rRNA (adenine2503-C2)-methyltransferase [Saprospiraceae bacterium]|jgi:23S rRNA (adenine2503-C2)-methyltransferase